MKAVKSYNRAVEHQNTVRIFRKHGFFRVRMLETAGIDRQLVERLYKKTHIDPAKTQALLEKYRYIVMGAFPIHAGSPVNLPRGSAAVASFARFNYYPYAVKLMKKSAFELGLAKNEIYPFSNSRFPEKLFAGLAGLGDIGKNSLLYTPENGSLCVLAGLALNIRLCLEEEPPPENGCGECTACIEACPTGAIVQPGVIDRGRCLQAAASRYGPVPDDVAVHWGGRLYGCDTCQDVCPRNSSPRFTSPVSRENLTEFVPVRQILENGLNGDPLRDMPPATAMHDRWLDKRILTRNAVLACRFNDKHAAADLLERCADHDDPVLRAAARQAKALFH